MRHPCYDEDPDAVGGVGTVSRHPCYEHDEDGCTVPEGWAP